MNEQAKVDPKQIVFAKQKSEYAKPKKEMIELRKRRIEIESKRIHRQIERDDIDMPLGTKGDCNG